MILLVISSIGLCLFLRKIHLDIINRFYIIFTDTYIMCQWKVILTFEQTLFPDACVGYQSVSLSLSLQIALTKTLQWNVFLLVCVTAIIAEMFTWLTLNLFRCEYKSASTSIKETETEQPKANYWWTGFLSSLWSQLTITTRITEWHSCCYLKKNMFFSIFRNVQINCEPHFECLQQVCHLVQEDQLGWN